jgi:hypothetical protein
VSGENEKTKTEEVLLSPQNKEIKECLFLLKRACQINYVRFDHLENFIFGEGQTTFNSSIALEKLAERLQGILGLTPQRAETLARYLVREGKQIEQSQITAKTKVLQCKVITCLQQNIN